MQIRVLGSLVEKEATVPDAYPLSTNALQSACNQRSSREPVVAYDESTVTATMLSLRERGLARTTRGEGSRVYKHSHLLRDALGLGEPELAVLSVLMLRGPQTLGELRTRTERQHGFATLEELESVLGRLARRDDPLAGPVGRRPGQKEIRWGHLLGGESGGREPSVPEPEPPPMLRTDPAAEMAALRDEVAELRERIEALERRV